MRIPKLKEDPMSVVEWKKEGTVALVTMTNGENRHNAVFVADMSTVLDAIEEDKEISSVVITSSDSKSWSQGIDLNWLMERMGKNETDQIKGFLYGINGVFKRLLTFPMPVIAAINGHAVANGAILSCACDFRLMRADKGFFFFPEIDINIPFLPGMIGFCRKAIPEYKFNEMLLSGKRYGAAELERHHIIVKACENQETLMTEAMAFAGTYQKKRGIFGEMKKRMYREMVHVIETEDPPIIEKLALMAED
jgi:enoyl-CoA hydratase/carnithine racemase